jgi:hypothetical protein
MSREELRLADAVAILERTPATVSALLDGMPETWVRATEGEGTWSPFDVVGDPRPFTPFDRTAQFTESEGKSLRELLATFTELRGRNVAELLEMKLGEGDLGRTGQHPDFGEVTLGQLLATWVVHDLDHVAQIARTMAKVYTDAVGPWQAYLSILRDRQG